MAHERVDSNTLVIECDHCHATYSFYGDEGSPIDEFVKCFRQLKDIGWMAQKPVGYDWEQYCPTCAQLPKADRIPTTRPTDA